ncbi:MAG: sensor domain-containing diguanylate cyclase [Aquihabitans sp.]
MSVDRRHTRDGGPLEAAGAAPPPSGLSDDAFRMIVDTLSLPILVVDQGGTIRYAAGSVTRDFGWTPDQLEGRNVIEFTPPEEAERAIQSVADLVLHDELGIGVPSVFGIIRADGELTYMAVGAVPLLQPPVEGIAFYFLPWDAQLHFDKFFAALLAGEPLEVVFARLGLSIAISLEAAGAVVHYGFDGVSFTGTAGTGEPDGCHDLVDSPWHRAVITGEPQYVATADLGTAARSVEAAGLGGCWAIPLPNLDGLSPAVLTVWRHTATSPVTAHDFVIGRSLTHVQLALVRSAEHRQLAHLADHDHLTGVANRSRFVRLVDEALAAGSDNVCLLYCDLDGFKTVNDSRGHGAGDAVLAEVAHRLARAIEGQGTLARIGGDEFTVLVRSDLESAKALGSRLLRSLDDPFTVDGEPARLGVSIGIAMAHVDSSADSLLKRADAALYEAKRRGGHQVCVASVNGSLPQPPSGARQAADPVG